MDYINECVVDDVEYALVESKLAYCVGCVADGVAELCNKRIPDCCTNKEGEGIGGNFIWIKKELK